jgi:hypothetical protein
MSRQFTRRCNSVGRLRIVPKLEPGSERELREQSAVRVRVADKTNMWGAKTARTNHHCIMNPPPWLIGRRPNFGFDFDNHQLLATGPESSPNLHSSLPGFAFTKNAFFAHTSPLPCDFASPIDRYRRQFRQTVQHLEQSTAVKMGESRLVSTRSPACRRRRARAHARAHARVRFRTRTQTDRASGAGRNSCNGSTAYCSSTSPRSSNVEPGRSSTPPPAASGKHTCRRS